MGYQKLTIELATMSYVGKPKFQNATLPNQMEVCCLQNNEEVFLIYEQVQEYFKHGIEINKGDTVFDVGANIGLFSLWVYKACSENVFIYAFEPIPSTFQVLEENIERLNSKTIKTIPCGLSQYSHLQNFDFYPNTTSISTAYPDGTPAERDKFKKAALQKIDNIRSSKDKSSPLYWYTKLPYFLLSFVLDRKLKKAFVVKQVECKLKTLSEVIREYQVQYIDLLKIDVEKSELDVLLGIESADWIKIKQIVLEVHDLENRVEKVKALLASNGFDEIIVEQEQYLKDTDIYNMYALRGKINSTATSLLDSYI